MSNEITPLMRIQNDVDEIFYDPAFMIVLERNLPLIRETAVTRPVEIERALRYKGNFDGFCKSYFARNIISQLIIAIG